MKKAKRCLIAVVSVFHDLGEDWSNNEIIQAVAIGEFTNLDGIEWRNGAETAADEFLMRLPVRKVPLQTKYREPDLVWL